MSLLNLSTPIHRAPEVDLTLESNGEVTFKNGNESIRLGPQSLKILDAVNEPTTVGSAIKFVNGNRGSDFLLNGIIDEFRLLISIGVLRTGPAASYSAKPSPMGQYDSLGIQIKLLNDTVRRKAFLNAITSVVKAGDVVLDIGTGSGIMAAFSVLKGAGHVYAIEPGRVSEIAKEVFKDNKVSPKITVIKDWIQNIDLPEKADVMVFDLLGFEALDMSIPEIVRDAWSRLLKDTATIIPNRIKFELVPVELPKHIYQDNMITPENVSSWIDLYGIDFSALGRVYNETVSVYTAPAEAEKFKRLSNSELIWDSELKTMSPAKLKNNHIHFKDVSPSKFLGLMGIMSVEMCKGNWFSTAPEKAGENPHWLTPLWISTQSSSFNGGDLWAQYNYLGSGRISVNFSENLPLHCGGMGNE